MANAIDFGTYGADQFDTAREALLRSTVSFAVGFILAKGMHREEMDTAAGEAFRTATKKMLREAGEDRKSADRHVNTATREVASKLVSQIDMSQIETGAAPQQVEHILATLKEAGVGNVAALKRHLTGKGAADPDGDGKSAADKAAEAEDKAKTAESDADDLMAQMMRNQVDPTFTPDEADTSEPAPEADDDPLAYVSDMDDATLAALAKRISEEMAARKAAKPEAAAA